MTIFRLREHLPITGAVLPVAQLARRPGEARRAGWRPLANFLLLTNPSAPGISLPIRQRSVSRLVMRAQPKAIPSVASEIHDLEEDCLPLYMQDWWVRIARGSRHFREARVVIGGRCVARLPYMVTRDRFGLSIGGAPDWSHLGGPVLSPSLSRPEKRTVLRKLIAQLPRHVSFDFETGPQTPDADLVRDAFVAAGFVHMQHNNYVQRPDQNGIFVDDPVDALGLQPRQRADAGPRSSDERNLNKTRSHIRSAARRLEQVAIDADAFIAFFAANLTAQGKQSYSPLGVARDLVAVGMARGQVTLIAVRRRRAPDDTADPPLDAAIACTSDRERLYLWMMTRRPAAGADHGADPNAMKLAIVLAARHARENGLVFDVDGVVQGQTEILYRSRLRIPTLELRDEFSRPTRVFRLAVRARTLLKQAKVRLSA
jgi:hypothetical protein